MLKLALDICKEENLKYAILGCYENNYGSNKTIIKNGGILYRTDYEEKQKCNYYKIEL